MLYPSGSSCNSSLEMLAGLKIETRYSRIPWSNFNPISISREELQELPEGITFFIERVGTVFNLTQHSDGAGRKKVC
jgi:hypothetical protein